MLTKCLTFSKLRFANFNAGKDYYKTLGVSSSANSD